MGVIPNNMSEEHTIKVTKTKDFPPHTEILRDPALKLGGTRAEFGVVLKGDSEHEYTVRLSEEYYQKLTQGKITPEQLIEKSFRFLLEREPASMILPEFELNLIQHYFNDYENKISVN